MIIKREARTHSGVFPYCLWLLLSFFLMMNVGQCIIIRCCVSSLLWAAAGKHTQHHKVEHLCCYRDGNITRAVWTRVFHWKWLSVLNPSDVKSSCVFEGVILKKSWYYYNFFEIIFVVVFLNLGTTVTWPHVVSHSNVIVDFWKVTYWFNK